MTASTSSADEAALRAQAAVDRLGADRGSLRVLDAGCGRQSPVRLDPRAHIVGLDIDPDELAAHPRLDEAIVGDLQEHRFPAGSFDLIVCWDVLEHLSRPELALERFAESIRPGGVVILGLPHVRSLKGIVTRFTPYWVHRRIYRWVGIVEKDGSARDPFPTYLRGTLAPGKLLAITEAGGLREVELVGYEGYLQTRLRERMRLTGWRWRAFEKLVHALSMGRVSAEASDLVIVLQSTAGPVELSAQRAASHAPA